MPAFPVGDPADPKPPLGRWYRRSSMIISQSYIRKGIEQGAELLVGGEGHPEGFERVTS